MFVAMMMFASVASLLAQGQIVERSSVLTSVHLNIGDISASELPASELLPPFQRPSFISGNLSLIEASRARSQNSLKLPSIPPSPFQDSSSLFQSSSFVLMTIDSFYAQSAPPSGSASDFQTSSLTIQAVPEPSTFALGGLAFVLIAVARVIRQGRPVS